MPTTDTTYAYLGGLTTKRGDDGFLYINGLVSNDSLDLDQQRCDPAWLNEAIPKWFKSAGNVRVMHQPVIGGKAKSITQSGTGWDANIKVTNKQADIDIEEGAITGLSVGIKNARVEKSLLAPKGLICGGDIIEVSLVDRPANPDCVLSIAKMAGSEWEFKGVEVFGGNQTDVVITQPITPDLEVGESFIPTADAALGDPVADKDVEAAADAAENISDAETFLDLDGKSANPDNVSVSENDDDLAKAFDFSDEDLAKFQKVLDGIVAKRKEVQTPAEDVQKAAVIEEGETDSPTSTGDDMSAYIALGVSPDLIKSASAEDASEEVKTGLRTELRKALGVDDAKQEEIDTLQKSVKTLEEEIAEIKELAAPGGPVLRQTSDQRRKSAAHDTISSKAAEIRSRADAFVGEPSVKQALYAEADKLENALSSL